MDAKGCIKVSRVSGTADLFGSDISHNSFIELSIHTVAVESESKLERFRWHPQQILIQVALSADQFVSMLTTMNFSEGVPCTLQRVGNQKIPPHKKEKPQIDRVQDAASESRDAYRKQVREAKRWCCEELARTKRDKEAGERIFRDLETCLDANMRFYEERLRETGENLKREIVSEAESQITMMVARAGRSIEGGTRKIEPV